MLGDASCALVSYPADELEAEQLLFPANGGLKLSAAVPRKEGVEIDSLKGFSKGQLLEILRTSLSSGDLENVKWVADALHKAGGDAVAELSAVALKESVAPGEREMALRALGSLDSSALKRVESARSSGSSLQSQKAVLERSQAREAKPLPNPGKTLTFGFLITLAILWPTYSIYRFYNPKAQEPPAPQLPWTDGDVEFESRAACQASIRQQLRDPDSADFPSFDSATVKVSYSTVDIKGYLHANNGLGLKVRVDYFCSIQADRQKRTLSLLRAQLVQR